MTDLLQSRAVTSREYTDLIAALRRHCRYHRQEDIAPLCGVTRSTVSRWISGARLMSLDDIITLCNALSELTGESVTLGQIWAEIERNHH